MPPSLTPSHSPAHLRAVGISKSFGDRRVLTDVSLTIPAGERTGLIGENGSGKTTLLRILAGALPPDHGEVHMSAPGLGHPRVGLLQQQPPFGMNQTLTEAMEAAVSPMGAAVRAVQQAAERLSTAEDEEQASVQYTAALETAERLEAWETDARVDAMLSGLGLGHIPRSRQTGQLSGGQRSRLALAWLLLNSPDVLLLDEPTNHLDDDATAYLNSVLASWTGPVLISSHDRAFLDETATTLVDLDPAPLPHSVAGTLTADGPGSGIGVTRFSGSYTEYLNARLDARERWEHQYQQEQAELRRLRAAVRDSHVVGHQEWKPRTEVRMAAKFYADRNAKVVSRRVNDARSRLQELEENQVRKPPEQLSFHGLSAAGPTTARALSGPALSISGATVTGRLSAVSLDVAAGEKWLVTGANGAGKSTLLQLLEGRIEPDGGTVNHAPGIRTALLGQEVELADPYQRGPERSVAQAYEDLVGPRVADEVPLSTFGLIAGRDQGRPVNVLSVGQQRRLELAVILADPPEVLLLDEPTNHLSLLLVTQLEAAIPHYPGSVVVASHDRWLRRRWAGHHLALGDERAKPPHLR